MALTKVLIAVKTYPSLSQTYEELVCTAGFLEDGTWIRIYPVPYRQKDYGEQYKKYEWIELDLVKNTKDFRPESFRPYSIDSPINIIDKVGTDNNWRERKDYALQNVRTNLTELIIEAKDQSKATSLATYKPAEIIDFTATPADREWNPKKIASIEAARQQATMFSDNQNPIRLVDKLPYTFRYKFLDADGTMRHMMIEDWETGALFWKMLKKYEGNEYEAVQAVKYKYLEDFAKTKDLHFYVGTTLQYHARNAPNPFVIIGTFTPKIEIQLSLF